MRRKDQELTDIEKRLLAMAFELSRSGAEGRKFHGRAVAQALEKAAGRKLPVAFGTLYRALDRMETMGILASDLEDAETAEKARRPRRREYRLTGAGERVALSLQTAGEGAGGLRLATQAAGTAPGGLRLATKGVC
jgi:PadR family transcriptional regulator PadR